jgi:hypothetical protein
MMNHNPLSTDTTLMALSLSRTRVSVPDHVITRAVGGSTVILDVNSGRSFTLDAVGSRVWTLLTETGSAWQARDALLVEFAVEAADLERDLEALIVQLADGRLLDIVDEPA